MTCLSKSIKRKRRAAGAHYNYQTMDRAYTRIRRKVAGNEQCLYASLGISGNEVSEMRAQVINPNKIQLSGRCVVVIKQAGHGACKRLLPQLHVRHSLNRQPDGRDIPVSDCGPRLVPSTRNQLSNDDVTACNFLMMKMLPSRRHSAHSIVQLFETKHTLLKVYFCYKPEGRGFETR
jgi:hypothetical protein